MDSYVWGIIFLTLLLSAFFSGMEIAFVTANKFKIELDTKQGDVLSAILSKFLKHPSRFIGAMLVGNNIALVVYGIFMAQILEPVIAIYVKSESVILLVQTIISTLIILITAEFLPKAVFRINPNSILRFFAIPIGLLYYILLIPMFLIIGLSEFILKYVFRMENVTEDLNFGRIDLEHYLRDATERNDLEQDEMDHEIQIFQNALDFSKVKARECMIPRTEITALEVNESMEVLRETFIDSGYSKILIYRDNIDNIIGYVHSFELFKRPDSIKSILLPVLIIPQSMSANEILELFIKQRKSVAVVVDEFGGTSGILTIEDVIEEIFGEIEDEHDKEELIEEVISETEYLFSARLEIDYLNDAYKLNLPEADNYETLAGLIISHYESIPKADTKCRIDNYELTVLKVSDNRIELIRLETAKSED
ncbi:HlyC/CorC family transporter [bacterium]|nr:HlyC/CorC family transporter [bacterium]